MAEGLVYKIGADIENLEKAVARVEVLLKDLSKAIGQQTVTAVNTGNKALDSFGQNDSVKQVTEQVNQLSTSADKASTEIDGLSKSIKSVPSIKKDVIPTTLPDTIDKAKKKAVDGSIALSNLGRVASDLPFGFIAIQNNIGPLFESFGQLSKNAGGPIRAFRAFGASLIGPAGLFFAFTVVTSAITSLIQKYGSLSNAITVLLAKNKYLAEATLTYNKEVAKAAGNAAVEEAKIASLTKALLSSNTSREKQLAYYNELKKIAPDIVAGISEENLGTQASNLLITSNTKLRAESVKLKIQEAGINAAATKNAEDLAIATKKESDAKLKLAQAEAQFKQLSGKTLAPGDLSIKTYGDAIINAKKEIKDAQNEIVKLNFVQSQYLGQLDPISLRIAEINKLTADRIKKLQEQEKAEKKTASSLNAGAKSAANYKYELQSLSEFKLNPEQLDVKNQIERLQELANVVLNVKASEEKSLAALNELKAIEPALFKGLDLQSKNYDKLKASIDVTNEGYLLQLNYLNSIAKASDKIQPQRPVANITPTSAAPIVAPIALPAAIDEFLAKQNQAKDALIEFRKQANLSAAYNLLNDTFFSPIQDLFSNFLETGKFAMADFGKAVLKAINQIVAKIIATGVIALLFQLFTGGFGAAQGGAANGFGKVLGAIGGALGFSGGKVAAPSFAGVGGGTLGMSGQVNLVLRGSDLVGSINRTNATINRVG